MMMNHRQAPECPPFKFEGSGSTLDNFPPSMDIHGALYVHCWDSSLHILHYTVHKKCTSVTIFSMEILGAPIYAVCTLYFFIPRMQWTTHFSQVDSTEPHWMHLGEA